MRVSFWPGSKIDAALERKAGRVAIATTTMHTRLNETTRPVLFPRVKASTGIVATNASQILRANVPTIARALNAASAMNCHLFDSKANQAEKRNDIIASAANVR